MKKVRFNDLVILASLVFPFYAHGWGSKGHQALAEVGAKLTKQGNVFWTANAMNIGTLANVPDNKWKSGASAYREKPLHFFQIDYFFTQPADFDQFPHAYGDAVKQYSASILFKNGLAPWRVQQLFDLAVQAFKNGDFATGVQMAGTMSHYIGDLSQPLHVTENFDGKDTGDVGIHAFFETTTLNSLALSDLEDEIHKRAQLLLIDPAFLSQFTGNALDESFREIDRTFPYKDKVIETDLKLGRKGKGAATQLSLAKDCLANGAATLAMILSEIWDLSGSPSATQAVKVGTPAWVDPML